MAPTTETASPIGIANVSHRVPGRVYNGMRGTSANLFVSLAAQPTVCISLPLQQLRLKLEERRKS